MLMLLLLFTPVVMCCGVVALGSAVGDLYDGGGDGVATMVFVIAAAMTSVGAVICYCIRLWLGRVDGVAPAVVAAAGFPVSAHRPQVFYVTVTREKDR